MPDITIVPVNIYEIIIAKDARVVDNVSARNDASS